MAAQLRLKLENPAPFRREDFVVGPSNADALALLDQWPHWRGGALALVGGAGAGKTHLATAWAVEAGARTVSAGSDPSDLLALEGTPVLLEGADRPGIDELLFHLINMAARPGGGLLLTARTPPKSWPATLPDLRSRLNALPVAALDEPDDALLTALLEKFFRERSIRPPDDLIPYLVKRIERSARRARAFVDLLDETADALRRPISKSLARELLVLDGEDADDR